MCENKVEKEGDLKMKLGMIGCMQQEDYCPGTTDFRVVREKTGVFADVREKKESIGFINCGGCSARLP